MREAGQEGVGESSGGEQGAETARTNKSFERERCSWTEREAGATRELKTDVGGLAVWTGA